MLIRMARGWPADDPPNAFPRHGSSVATLRFLLGTDDIGRRSVTLDHRGVAKHLRKMLHKDSRLVTDKAQHYALPPVASHESVDHSKFEWTRGDVHTNTLEGFFSIVKRGLVGVYQRVDTKHLDRYLAEFDFRQNTRQRLGIDDTQRARLALKGAVGKRLTYETTDRAQA